VACLRSFPWESFPGDGAGVGRPTTTPGRALTPTGAPTPGQAVLPHRGTRSRAGERTAGEPTAPARRDGPRELAHRADTALPRPTARRPPARLSPDNLTQAPPLPGRMTMTHASPGPSPPGPTPTARRRTARSLPARSPPARSPPARGRTTRKPPVRRPTIRKPPVRGLPAGTRRVPVPPVPVLQGLTGRGRTRLELTGPLVTDQPHRDRPRPAARRALRLPRGRVPADRRPPARELPATGHPGPTRGRRDSRGSNTEARSTGTRPAEFRARPARAPAGTDGTLELTRGTPVRVRTDSPRRSPLTASVC